MEGKGGGGVYGEVGEGDSGRGWEEWERSRWSMLPATNWGAVLMKSSSRSELSPAAAQQLRLF